MIDEVERPAAATEDSTALLTWLISALKATAGDVAAMRAVMTLIPLNSELAVGTEAVADPTILAAFPAIAELTLLDSSTETTLGTALELDPSPTLPPKGDSEMNVGVEPPFWGDVAGMFEALRLLSRMLTFEAMVAVKAGTPISDGLCRPVNEVEEPSKPATTAVMLFAMMVMDDSDPYPGGTPEDGPFGNGNLVT